MKSRRSFVGRGWAAWLLALALAAFGALAVSPARAQELVVRIGHVGPLTGPLAAQGKDSESGARMALEELNAKGVTIGGRRAKFELLAEDEGAASQGGSVGAARRLVDAKARGVIGHLDAQGAIAATKVYGEAGIPHLSAGVTSPAFTRQGLRTTFRLVADEAQVGATLGKYAVGQFQARSIAVIDDRSPSGQALADEFEKAVRAAGGRIAGRASTTGRVADLTAALSTLKARKPDAVFFGGADAVGGPLIRQMKQAGIEARVLGGPGLCTIELPKLAAPAMADGQVVCAEAGGVPGAGRKAMDDFLSAYRARHGAMPQGHAASAYDAAYLLVAAMVGAGSADPPRYLPFLARTEGYRGVTGTISFDTQGNLREAPLTLHTYTGGRRETIGVVR